MAGGITLIKIHPKIWKWIQFPLSHVGSSTDEGMRKWWLSEHNQVSTGRKINGKKTKQIMSVRMEQRCMDLVSSEYLLWNENYLRENLYFLEILKFVAS